MVLFFITTVFLAFCITVIALNSKQADISALAIKILGTLSKSEPARELQGLEASKDELPKTQE